MRSIPTLDALRTATVGCRFTCALLAAMAANFLIASGHDQQRILQIVVLGAALAVAIARGTVRRAVPVLPAGAGRSCLAFLALGLAATVGTVAPAQALTEWATFVMLGLGAIVVGAEVATLDADGRYRLLLALGWICALHALRILLAYGAGIASGVPFNYQLLMAGFTIGRFFNHAQTALLPMLVLLGALAPARGRTRKAAFLLAGFWWALLLFSEARATLLGLAAGIGVVCIVRRSRALGFLKALAIGASLGLCLYVVLFIVAPMVTGGIAEFGTLNNMILRSTADPATGRLPMWTRALHLIVQRPLLGVGPVHFAHFGADLGLGSHPHDWLLQVGSDWGLPALACLLALPALGARGLMRAGAIVDAHDAHDAFRVERQATCSALIVAVTAIVIDSLFSGVLVMPQSQLALVFVFGFALGWTRSLGGHAMRPASRIATNVAAPLGIAALCLLAVTTGPDFARKWEDRPLTAAEERANPTLWPRLWEAGHF